MDHLHLGLLFALVEVDFWIGVRWQQSAPHRHSSVHCFVVGWKCLVGLQALLVPRRPCKDNLVLQNLEISAAGFPE